MGELLENLKLYSEPWNGDPSEGRNSFIGGSDVGTILGVNKFKSPYVLFLEKTGKLEPENIDNKLQVKLGHKMEQVVAELYEEETGIKLTKSNRSYRCEKYPFLVGHIDRKMVGVKKGLEIKTTSSWNRTDYSEGEVPPSHYYQCMFYMMITGIHDWDLATLRDNNEFHITHIKWDEQIAEDMLKECIDFWKCVESGVWDKPIDGEKNTSDAITRAFPAKEEKSENASTSVAIYGQNDAMESYMELVSSIKELEKSKSAFENEIKTILGENQVGFIGDEYKVTWMNRSRKGSIDTDKIKSDYPEIDIEKYRKPEKKYREFKITPIKKERIERLKMTEARVPNRAVNTANTAVQTAKKANFSSFIKAPNVYKSIEGTLGSSVKAKTFVSSVISAVNTNAELAKCEPTSIISAALLGESLNLSPSPQLAQYYMVPFNDKTRGKVATFILGWKGYYQLAMRSGAYKKLHAIEIKEGELVKCDPINEEYEFSVIEDPAERASKKTIGYYAFFETVNGFRKSMYWTREQMEMHANTYSNGYKRRSGYTFWEKDFDSMGIKTMFRQIISKYGIMSIELRTAFENDESFSDKLPEDGNFTEQVHFDAVNTFDAETGEVIDN